MAAGIADPGGARAAASQDWPAFVLVGGLILIGLVADDDGLFAACGNRLAGLSASDLATFAAVVVLVATVTAVLNLDTSVAFLTPVLVHLARKRGSAQGPLLYGCLLLSNAGSLLLPGSNLTNLIVLGHLNLSGDHFVGRMTTPFVTAVVITALVLAVAHHGQFSARRPRSPGGADPTALDDRRASATNIKSGPTSKTRGRSPKLGVVSVLAATVVVVVLRSPALPVAIIGACAIVVRLLRHSERLTHVIRVLEAQVLTGLFGIAVALGALGRSWDGPGWLLSHLGSWATAPVAAVASVLFNNLPAASLFAARVPPHPYSLLVGLNLGPNLFVTGSLSSLLWLKSARRAGANPSIWRVARLGVLVVPLSMAGALGALAASGAH